MNYSKLNLPRIPDAIAHQLEARILEGSLKPGDRLPAERELAIELGVSRPSLREALKQLVSRELLVSRHGGGTYVTDRLESSFVDPWQQLMDQHPSLQDDVFEFRYLLEASAAELAAQEPPTPICSDWDRRMRVLTLPMLPTIGVRRWRLTSPFT
jgi:GntR family transcriptional repressor for pyruvate dehydrogenase complex